MLNLPKARRRKLLGVSGVVAVAVAALAVVVPMQAHAVGKLLSQGKPVSVSSTENPSAFPAKAAVDGDPGTRWSSAFGDPQWIQVDLGASRTITEIGLQWEASHAKAFKIQVSDSASTWTDLYSTTSGTGGNQTLDVRGTGRYVRLYGTERSNQYGYSLWEFQVYGEDSGGSGPTPTPSSSTGPGDVELSYTKPATASTFQNDGSCSSCTAAKVTDGDVTTRWATSSTNGWVDPGWVYVDLGKTAEVHRVVLHWDAAYAKAYQLQVSNDANNWTTIHTATAGKGYKENVTGLKGTGRYLRVYGTARSNGYGYSLWELQVFGTGGDPVTPPAKAPNISLPATRMVFQDEFDKPAGSTPDASRWTADPGTGQNGELQYYTDNKNATMDGSGNLVIEARRETPPQCAGCQYTSGRINTAKTFTFTYGRAEARIKVSGTQGLWPAFWMLGADFPTVGWPRSGEIDIMEHVGKVPDTTYSTLHAPAYYGGGGYGRPYTVAGTDFANDFHTYAVEWDATHMTFFVDGKAFFTADKETIESTRGPWVYDHPFYLILNNAVGGEWPGAPDSTTQLPQKMLIDYVRVYQ